MKLFINMLSVAIITAILSGCGTVNANDFYTATGAPAYRSANSSSTMRAEFAAIEDGFDVLPGLTGNGSEVVVVNVGGTVLETKAIDDIVGATTAELTTLTDGSDASSLHTHTTANLNDTTATGANLNTLTDASDASSLHNHTTANLNDTTATGANLNTLTDGSLADSLHYHVAAAINNNLLINPNFIVNQIGFAGTPVAGEYTFDMWKALYIASSPSVSVSGDDVTIVNARIQQRNDDLINLSGGADITLTASVSTGSVLMSDLVDETQVITPGNPFTFTYNSGSASGVYIGSLSATYTFSGLKLEVGSVETLYAVPQVTQEELKCERYYWRGTPKPIFAYGDPFTSSSRRYNGDTVLFRVKMRTTPTLTAITPSSLINCTLFTKLTQDTKGIINGNSNNKLRSRPSGLRRTRKPANPYCWHRPKACI